jgi:anti-sigma B factor antagonist
MGTTFQLGAIRTGNGLWLSLSGDFDQVERDRLIAALDAQATPRELVIEMSGVDFIGSAGLSALIHAARRLGAVDRRVVLLDPPASVMRMLDICGISQLFAIQLT